MIISSKDAYKISTKLITPEDIYQYRVPNLLSKEIFKEIFQATLDGKLEINFEVSVYEDFKSLKHILTIHPFEYKVRYKQKEDDNLKLIFTISWNKKEEENVRT